MISWLIELDKEIFLTLNSLHHPWLNGLMSFLSGKILWVPLIIFFFYYSFRSIGGKKTLYFGLFLILGLIASDVTSSYILKNFTNRLRPCREADLMPLIYSFGQKCGGKFGFVSSHAANSIALIFFSLRTLNFKSKWINLAWFVPILVSYSRLYLGVHYPGDLVGGSLVGFFWAYFFSKMYKNIQGASR
jgi:undecaprenyl-diphosphatase